MNAMMTLIVHNSAFFINIVYLRTTTRVANVAEKKMTKNLATGTEYDTRNNNVLYVEKKNNLSYDR